MNRKNFLQKAGTLGLGAGVLALIRPTSVEGGGTRQFNIE